MEQPDQLAGGVMPANTPKRSRDETTMDTMPGTVNGSPHRPPQVTMKPIVIPGRAGDEFRAASGLASWSPAAVVSELVTQEPPQEAAPEPEPPAAGSRLDGDTAIRLMTAFVVLAVAAFAAVVSYSHIFDLGVHHGQSGTAARLLPLSVDGLIAAASLAMLHAARNKLPVPMLARAMLALGVAATVAANVAYGLPFGVVGSLVSAWPAIAFVGSVEMAIRFVGDTRRAATEPATDPASSSDTAAGKTSDTASDKTAGSATNSADTASDARSAPKAPPQRQRPAARTQSGGDKVRAILKRNPGLAKDVVAKRAGVSERTVERVMGEISKAAS